MSLKKVRFPKNGPFSIQQGGFQFDKPNISLIFAGLTLMILKEFRL
jgi:hypothetical protein